MIVVPKFDNFNQFRKWLCKNYELQLNTKVLYPFIKDLDWGGSNLASLYSLYEEVLDLEGDDEAIRTYVEEFIELELR